VADDEELQLKKINQLQNKVQNAFNAQKANLERSALAFRSLTRETIKIQHALLPSRYLLVVDNRKVYVNFSPMTAILCPVRRYRVWAQL
jgi:hypothetical protein